MIVLIDNYDSFTYNLVQYIGEFDPDIKVIRNDKIDAEGVRALGPDAVVVSPGPCTPNEAGCSKEVIGALAGSVPILGVCLGHQSIGAVFGGNVVRADRIMHGKVSDITQNGNAIFDGVESTFEATRYHSLIVERESCPDELEIIAETEEGEIMALAHRTLPVWGLQFHPESILTGCGKRLIENFVNMSVAAQS
ncbi:MAG TPA: aminodeoxychorismate/anthranilate synthase component II [Candidatus Hydrogenedentes bacterium]|nr:aminodeoxychorismate/anthranilate synthase component II [Candidatus Hydrogenedentota bacterium]